MDREFVVVFWLDNYRSTATIFFQGIHAWPRRLSWHPGIQASSGARGLRNSGPNGRRQPRQVALAPFDFNAHDARFSRKGWLSFLNSPDL